MPPFSTPPRRRCCSAGNTAGSRPATLNRVPAWSDEQFLELLKQGLLNLRKDQLQKLYEGQSAAPPHRRITAGVHQLGAGGKGDERAHRLHLAREGKGGSDLREQLGVGMQKIVCGDGAGCLALEQAHELVHQGQLVLRMAPPLRCSMAMRHRHARCRANRRGASWESRPSVATRVSWSGAGAAPGPQ